MNNQPLTRSASDVNGVSVSYVVSGHGKDLVLLHGWGCDATIFTALQTHLSASFRVWALDFPGFGQSAEPPEVWGVDEYTTFTEQFLLTHGIENPILLGHSFGGRVGILLASRNRVHKLILAGSAGVKPRRPFSYYAKVYSYKAAKRVLSLPLIRKWGEPALAKYRNKAGSSDYNNASGIMRQVLVKVVNEYVTDRMPLVNAPSLLIWGENDTATPVHDAKVIEQLIPDAGLVVLKNAGHYCFLDKAIDFRIIVDNFLQKEKTA